MGSTHMLVGFNNVTRQVRYHYLIFQDPCVWPRELCTQIPPNDIASNNSNNSQKVLWMIVFSNSNNVVSLWFVSNKTKL